MSNNEPDDNWVPKLWNLGDVFFEIGNSFLVGKDCTMNNCVAAIWFGLAAAKGHTGAQINLGLMLGEGRGLPTDFDWGLNVAGAIAREGDEGAIKAVELILLLSKLDSDDNESIIH